MATRAAARVRWCAPACCRGWNRRARAAACAGAPAPRCRARRRYGTSHGRSPRWTRPERGTERATTTELEARTIAFRRALNFGREAPTALAELLGCGPRNQVCILVDQFEELFEHARRHGPEEAALLAACLVGLLDAPPAGLYAVLTMRSEFLGACSRYEGFAEAVNRAQYLLPRMEHDDLMRAIREPAVLYDGEVTRELAERLIVDGGGGQDQLPLIQHGLMLLHDERAHSRPGLVGPTPGARHGGSGWSITAPSTASPACSRRTPTPCRRAPNGSASAARRRGWWRTSSARSPTSTPRARRSAGRARSSAWWQ